MSDKWFIVSGTVTISVHTRVKAPTKKAARKEAEMRGIMGLCHQCAGSASRSEEWRTSGELDGEPFDLRVEVDDE